ncbi:MAG TPA: hypothetical protein VE957_19105, partial [Terriglobales bacterium]|nr:hypothetical protein [Terriglobales bacterium]
MANRSLAAQKAAATKASNKKKSQALRENAIDTFDSLPGKFQMELIEAVRQVATDYEYTVNATLEQAESEGLDTLHALVEKYGPGLVRLAAEDMTVWHEPVA